MSDLLLLGGIALCLISVLVAVVQLLRTQPPRAAAILLVLGWVSFTKLAVTRLPSADIPVISVAVSQFGAAPSELESQVTKTIEDGVSGVEGVRHISSSITDGLSVTTIQFALETNTDRALNDVKDAVTRVRANLPQNVTEPLIQRVDVIGLPIVTYAAISPGKTPEQLSYFVDDVVNIILWLLEREDISGVFNAGSGQARSFADLARATFAAAGKEPSIAYVDMPEAIRDRYQYFTEASMDRIRALGYVLDKRGFDLAAQSRFDSLAPLFVLARPASLGDG